MRRCLPRPSCRARLEAAVCTAGGGSAAWPRLLNRGHRLLLAPRCPWPQPAAPAARAICSQLTFCAPPRTNPICHRRAAALPRCAGRFCGPRLQQRRDHHSAPPAQGALPQPHHAAQRESREQADHAGACARGASFGCAGAARGHAASNGRRAGAQCCGSAPWRRTRSAQWSSCAPTRWVWSAAKEWSAGRMPHTGSARCRAV